MPQYRASSQVKTAQLLTYPVLMAHDIIGYRRVYVGDDQISHVEFARRLIRRYSSEKDCPEPIFTPHRVMDLVDTKSKMSKSSPNGCIFLDDTREDIDHKVRKATTDANGVDNLRFLYDYFVGEPMPFLHGESKPILSLRIFEEINK